MPFIFLLIILMSFFALFFFQIELVFFLNFYCLSTISKFFSDLFFNFLNYDFFSIVNFFAFNENFQKLTSTQLDYDYNYRTYFSQTYLHAAYNKHIKPYRNLLSADRFFGDYNTRTYGKSKKHARAMKHTRLFFLLYSHSVDFFAFNDKLASSPSVLFYFKRHHFYSVLEMFYASVYLGMIYFFSFTYTRMIEDSALEHRKTEELEEAPQNEWFYFREDRRGIIEPEMEDNEELNFKYPEHPVEWDDNGYFYRWEAYFFIFLFSFLICWGVSQSALSMFYYDDFIDLHFVTWSTTLALIFLFWRLFFLVQFFTFFNRFNFRRFFYIDLIFPFFTNVVLFLVKFLSPYLWPYFYSTFSRNLKIDNLEINNYSSVNNLISLSNNVFFKEIIIKFYRFIYSSFQKNLNFFEKRNKYDFLMSSNLMLFHNSNIKIDNIFYNFFKMDRLFNNMLSITFSFIDKYRFNNGFFFPKNMYLTTNKIVYSPIGFFPNIFPFYLDFYNLNELPMWGADLFFNQTQNVFSYSESSESWFFARQYNTHFEIIKSIKDGLTFKNLSNNNFFT